MPADERAAYRHVFESFHRLNQRKRQAGKPELSIGTVHAYVLTASGEPFDSLHVAQAGPERLIAMLEGAVNQLQVPAGTPSVKPTSLSVAPRAQADALVLHLTARYLVPQGDPEARKNMDGAYVPVAARLGTDRSGQWSALPSEDWIVLEKSDWQRLLPSATIHAGASWTLDPEVTARLLTRFYPTTENNDLLTNRIDQQSLRATAVSIKDGLVRARIDGRLHMKHSFYPHREDDKVVEATLLGYLDFNQNRSQILGLRLITDRATYGGASTHFGAALRSVPAATATAR